MKFQTAPKQLKDLQRIESFFKKAKKGNTSLMFDTLLKYGSVKITNGFNGISILFVSHSRVLQNGIKNTQVLTTFQKHEKEIKNQTYSVLAKKYEDINKRLKKRVKELEEVITKQEKNEFIKRKD